MAEKRKLPRIPWSGKVSVQDPLSGAVVASNGLLRNVGRRGFAFITETHLTRGTPYKFRIDTAEKTLQAEGAVIHEKNEVDYFLYGIKITDMSIFDRGRLNRAMASRSWKVKTRFLLYSLAAGGIAWILLKLILGFGWMEGLITFLTASLIFFYLMPF